MKGYAILLGVLFVSSLATRLMTVSVSHEPLARALAGADIVAFGLCLVAAVEMAFHRRWLTSRFGAQGWRLVSRGALVLGAFAVASSAMSRPMSAPGLLQLGLMLVPYVVFAIPVILFENELKAAA